MSQSNLSEQLIQSKYSVHQSQTLEFQNLKLSVVNKGTNQPNQTQQSKMKEILKDLSGFIQPGKFTAIMGPTGCGKTSLLNALAGRIEHQKNSEFTGSIYQNGQLVKDKVQNGAYVMQNDILFPHLTVEETLMYAAHFYLSKKMNEVQKKEHVEQLMNQLGIINCRNTLIGDNKTRGVSGGEKKRVNIAVEMIQNPEILFLDEPTSGLDSFQAFSVCQSLQKLALQQNRTVVSSIHQPSSIIVDLFDNLILMSQGNIIYNGTNQNALKYFEEQGFQCPNNYNKTDFYLELVSPDYRSEQQKIESLQRIEKLIENWKKNGHKWSFDIENQEKNENQILIKKEYGCADMDQFYYLFKRQFYNKLRNKFLLFITIFMQLFFALVIGGIYSSEAPGYKGIQNKIGVLFFIAINQVFSNLQGTLNTFISEKVTIQKEISSRAYRLHSYYLAKIFAEMPFNFIGPTIFACIIYWIVHLDTDVTKFFNFLFVLIIEVQIAVCFGLLISAYAPNIEIAQAMAPAVIVIFFQFAGVFINLNALPEAIQWVKYISFIRWVMQALSINEFADKVFEPIPTDPIKITSGNELLEQYGFDGYSFNESVLANVYIMTFLFVAAFIVLKFTQKNYMRPKQI